jgi:putative ABC transport system permease protein
VSFWRQLTHGLSALRRRSAADRDIAEEVEHYLAQATADQMARGLSPAEARRAARLGLGDALSVREQVRDYGWENRVETLLGDLRYAARRLRAAPGFTAITVLTLALGMGATTAIFSAVKAVLFETLPYPESGRIVMLWEHIRDGSRASGMFGTYHALSERVRSFAALAVLKPWQPTLTGADEPERLEGQSVSAEYFRVLGVTPALGRDFQRSDDVPGGPRVVILSDALWRRRFAADRAIVGRAITLDDDPWIVVGVMPAQFENVLAPRATLWTPLQYDLSQGRAWGHHLHTVARLRPGVGLAQARQELAALWPDLVRENPKAYFSEGPLLVSLQDDITRAVKPTLYIILVAVLLVLVIACVNVTNLLLARSVTRRGEFALRTALGAGRGRLMRQLITESLLLAALGGLAGVAVALAGVRVLVALSPMSLPRAAAIDVDGVALAFTLGITTLVGLLLGVIPALQAARVDPHREMQQGSLRLAGRHRGARNALVVAEVALALMLLVSSGLLLRSLQRLFAVAFGFDASNLLTMQVQTSGHRFDQDSSTWRFFAEALDAVRRLPGVTAAALTSQLPLSGDDDEYGVQFDPRPGDRPDQRYNIFRYAVSPGWFETMRMPLRAGRLFEERDRAGAPLVALIGESLAKRRFGERDPVGERLRLGPPGPPYTIIGVVGDIKQLSLAQSEADAVYTPASQWRFADNAMSLVVRARGAAATLAPAVRQAVWSVDRNQPIVRVATMDDLMAASAADRRFALILFEAFALAALVLAAAGMYGVLAGSVAERTREIGVRSALGASRRNILSLVFRQGLMLTALGVAIGWAGAAATTQAIVALLFGVSRLDPVTYLGVSALLLSVALLACLVPAWRALRVDPATTLRAD